MLLALRGRLSRLHLVLTLVHFVSNQLRKFRVGELRVSDDDAQILAHHAIHADLGNVPVPGVEVSECGCNGVRRCQGDEEEEAEEEDDEAEEQE